MIKNDLLRGGAGVLGLLEISSLANKASVGEGFTTGTARPHHRRAINESWAIILAASVSLPITVGAQASVANLFVSDFFLTSTYAQIFLFLALILLYLNYYNRTYNCPERGKKRKGILIQFIAKKITAQVGNYRSGVQQ